MKIKYEGVRYHFSTSSSIERALVKLWLRKKIGRFIGKPYRKDSCLSFYEALLSRISHPVVIDVGANIGAVTLPLAKKMRMVDLSPLNPTPCQHQGLLKIAS